MGLCTEETHACADTYSDDYSDKVTWRKWHKSVLPLVTAGVIHIEKGQLILNTVISVDYLVVTLKCYINTEIHDSPSD